MIVSVVDSIVSIDNCCTKPYPLHHCHDHHTLILCATSTSTLVIYNVLATVVATPPYMERDRLQSSNLTCLYSRSIVYCGSNSQYLLDLFIPPKAR